MADSTQARDENQNRSAKRCRQHEVVVKETQWPVVYSTEYNIGFCGLEKLHPFDAGKWGRIFEFLKAAGMLREDTIVEPFEANEEELLFVHSKRYLSSLRWSMTVAGITEIPPVALLPNFIVQKKVLRPFRYHTSGTIMAGKLAMDRGWAINIGGGFHHCSSDRGGGFCAYADITLSVKFLLDKVQGVSKVLIVDLDAHQGNGHARDFMGDERVYILDVYNRDIYPHDGFAKRAIKRKVEIRSFTQTEEYLQLVRTHVEGALNEFDPSVVVYNAGTDILDGDPLGLLAITAQGVIERDQIVFQKCRTRGIPIFMVTSGGYLRETARIVADSILNLRSLSLISCDAAENCPLVENNKTSPNTTNLAPPPTAIPRSQSDGGIFARFKRSCLNRSSCSSTSTQSIDNVGTTQTTNNVGSTQSINNANVGTPIDANRSNTNSSPQPPQSSSSTPSPRPLRQPQQSPPKLSSSPSLPTFYIDSACAEEEEEEATSTSPPASSSSSPPPPPPSHPTDATEPPTISVLQSTTSNTNRVIDPEDLNCL